MVTVKRIDKSIVWKRDCFMKHFCGSISYLDLGILFSNPQSPSSSIIQLDGNVLQSLFGILNLSYKTAFNTPFICTFKFWGILYTGNKTHKSISLSLNLNKEKIL